MLKIEDQIVESTKSFDENNHGLHEGISSMRYKKNSKEDRLETSQESRRGK
jgi:hypothetical protein